MKFFKLNLIAFGASIHFQSGNLYISIIQAISQVAQLRSQFVVATFNTSQRRNIKGWSCVPPSNDNNNKQQGRITVQFSHILAMSEEPRPSN